MEKHYIVQLMDKFVEHQMSQYVGGVDPSDYSGDVAFTVTLEQLDPLEEFLADLKASIVEYGKKYNEVVKTVVLSVKHGLDPNAPIPLPNYQVIIFSATEAKNFDGTMCNELFGTHFDY
jgi:hypothetical protein